MKKGESKIQLFSRILIVLLVVFLSLYFVSIISGFSPFYNEAVEKNALVEVHDDGNEMNALIEKHFEELRLVEIDLIDKNSHEAIANVLTSYIGSEMFGDLRFFSNGKIYDVHGMEVVDENEKIMAFSGLNRKSFSGDYSEDFPKKSCMAFYIPIVGSTCIDGLVSIIEARNFINLDSIVSEKSQTVAVINESGVVFCNKIKEGETLSLGNNYYDFIKNFTQNKEIGDKVADLVSNKKSGIEHILVGSVKYVVAVEPLEAVEGKLFAVSLSLSENLMEAEMEYLTHIISLLVIAVISLVVSLIYAWMYHKSSKKQIRHASYTYQDLDCPNIEQFKLDVVNNMTNSSMLAKKYSVVAFKMRRFNSICKILGEKETTEALKSATKIFAGVCSFDEAYAYMGNGVFVMLIKYTGEVFFVRKINMIKALSAKNSVMLSKDINLRFRVGVCHAFGGTKGTAMEMVDNAVSACKLAEEKANASFVVYDVKINEEIAKNEKIESMMEEGLANGDFKLFLQPKYNIKTDKIDSAEALVRWFDREKADYIFPGEFIGLFETNGFIVKLDHYIYIEVLKYFKSAVERGENIVPISVNVSRVTATATDFLDFYISNKKKYEIGDGFIMLELTESFAFEDNKTIVNIVNSLHQNGIKCALDDFGAGFSSFRTLKNIAFDELKLDRCFIEKDADPQKGDVVLKTVIGLFKSLGMKVVQEGVETEEMLKKIAEYGCDVAQGFYYAKAIPLEEYKLFLKSNTSITFKSKVK